MDDEQFLADLRAQLLGAAEHPTAPSPQRQGGRLVLLGAVAAVLVAVAAGVLVVRTEDQAGADVDVIVDGRDLIVRLTDLKTRPQEIVRAAREAGLDVRVRRVPVGPSNVGKFIESTASIPGDFRPIDPEGGSFTGFRISRDWPGTLELMLGRQANDDEKWTAASDALEPGEPLACEPILGESVRDASKRLADSGLNVRWFMLPAPGEVEPLKGYESWRVVQVQATGAQDVTVMSTADGTWPFPIDKPTLPRAC